MSPLPPLGFKSFAAFAPDGAYDALATVIVPSGGLANITFTGVPTGYKHLQIRGFMYGSSTGASPAMRFNGDTGANYQTHALAGAGSGTPGAYAYTSTRNTNILSLVINGVSTGTSPSVGIWDILDYSDTNKYKTTRTLIGYDANGSGEVDFTSGAWRNTNAISSITLLLEGGSATYGNYSSFALYGVK